MKFFNLFILLIIASAVSLITSCAQTEPNQPLLAGEPEVVTTGYQFTEGPYWHSDGFLIFSDIPANKIYKWEPESTGSEVYIDSTGNSNGIAATPDGVLILAQHAGKISKVVKDKELVPIAEEYEGKRLNSPNDVVVRSDGLIYFTDPTFGVSDEDRKLEITGVYRINADSSLTLLYEDFVLPNGIVFSPDESKLYVSDSQTGRIVRFDVLENGDLENPTEFATIGELSEMGGADGMTVDADGRLYTTGPNGLIVFDSEGNRLEQITFDQQVTNVAFGGEDGNDLFITSRDDVLRVRVNK
ncbi:MAG: SMP-30/gluconolactonase/LRE family protein [Balneolaceae bacterium]|nr:SMP-30/gluconolactonase/LRE family protein [Balneolaceae bacterium]